MRQFFHLRMIQGDGKLYPSNIFLFLAFIRKVSNGEKGILAVCPQDYHSESVE
jgi:hypothetical protein